MRRRQRLLALVALFSLFAAALCAARPTRAGEPAPATQPAGQALATRTEYFAAFLGGSRIGYAVMTRTASADRVINEMKMEITLKRFDRALTTAATTRTVETADGKPLSYTSEQKLGTIAQTVAGEILPDGQLRLTIESPLGNQTQTIRWPKGALLDEGQRLLHLSRRRKPGDTYTMVTFDPSSAAGLETLVTVGKKKNVDLLGRVVPLTEITSQLKAPTGVMTVLSYLDEDGVALKVRMPIIGTTIELVACTREVALGEIDPVDIMKQVIVQCPKPSADPRKAAAVTYVVAPKGSKKITFPAGDSQKVSRQPDGTIVVTVRPVAAPAGAMLPYEGEDKAALAALKPSRFVESDAKEVVALAREAVGDTRDAAEAVRRIEAFVAKYITGKSLSVGYASAREVVAGRQGDCTEHAVLAAALCRAVGIPAQVVTGLVYVEKYGSYEHVLFGHAWAQAYVGGKWVGLDAALHRYDAGHVALAVGDGDPVDFFGMVNTLGNFTVEKIVIIAD